MLSFKQCRSSKVATVAVTNSPQFTPIITLQIKFKKNSISLLYCIYRVCDFYSSEKPTIQGILCILDFGIVKKGIFLLSVIKSRKNPARLPQPQPRRRRHDVFLAPAKKGEHVGCRIGSPTRTNPENVLSVLHCNITCTENISGVL